MLKFLQSICQKLETKQIDYMLSGSLALNAYTVPRMTRDIDIVIALRPEQLQDFLSLFSETDTYFSKPAIQSALEQPGMFNIIDFETGYKVDFIVLKSEPFRQKEFSRRQRSESFGFLTWIVSPEDLILSKLIWIQTLSSDRQQEDLKHLLAIKPLDHEYIHDWIIRLNLQTFGLFDA